MSVGKESPRVWRCVQRDPPAGACDGTRAGGYAAGVTGSTIHNFRSYLVHPLTRRVLQELGIDASGLRAKGIRLFLGKVPIRYAVVVCERANRSCPKVYPFAARTLYWPLEDPAEAEGSCEDRLAVFRRVRDENRRPGPSLRPGGRVEATGLKPPVTEDRAMARIGRVSYRSGFVERLEEAERLPAITIEAADLPEDVLATNSKAVRRIHQVCCRLDDIATGRRQS